MKRAGLEEELFLEKLRTLEQMKYMWMNYFAMHRLLLREAVQSSTLIDGSLIHGLLNLLI